jgi:type I restriction enzyme S subunit
MDGRRTIRTTLRGVSNQGAAELKGKLLPPGSVAVSCIGWQLGKAVIVGTEAYCNQQLNVVIPNTNVDATYLYYHLITRREEIRNLGSVGTRTPILKKSAFERLEIPLPPIHVQRKIAAILSSYDDLIENNTRRIELLDEMAQRIYSEWFVDYRFPGHDVVALVDSELGQIPDGWKVGVIGDVLEVLEAGSRPKGGIDPSERGVPSVGAENVLGLGRYEFEREKFISSLFFEQMRRGRVVSGDVVLYKDGAYIGRVSLFRDGFPHDECAVNEHVFILRTNRQLSQSFMYFWLAEPGNQDRVKSLNANSAQPGINQEKLKSLAIVLPPSELVQRFTERIEPMLALLFNLARSLRVLKGARDLLLPRLISGDLDVSDLEIAFLETAT